MKTFATASKSKCHTLCNNNIDKATKSNNNNLQLNNMSTHIYFWLRDFNLIYQFIVENLSFYHFRFYFTFFHFHGHFFILPFFQSVLIRCTLWWLRKNRQIIISRNCNTKLFPVFFFLFCLILVSRHFGYGKANRMITLNECVCNKTYCHTYVEFWL